MLTAGTDLVLDIERPATGGRMIARHGGRVVLVAGAIPGEQVRARVERAERTVAYATVVDVPSPSPDRRSVTGDPACGGCVFAHIAYARQTSLKGEIVVDAFRRIGKVTLDSPVPVEPSPERGYRMRARFHVRGGRVGFFREGTHDLCDPATTDQLLPDTINALDGIGRELDAVGGAAVRSIELVEDLSGNQRALHLELRPGDTLPASFAGLARVPGVTGVTGQAPPADLVVLGGRPWVADPIEALLDRPAGALGGLLLRRRPAAFFQANRYLLPALITRLVDRVEAGSVVDLYAGVGVFALSLSALGWTDVTAVEGDRVTGEDLVANADAGGGRLRVERRPVESFLEGWRGPAPGTVIVDPPRTGVTRRAMEGILALRAPRVVYVSCDVATLARDVRRLLDAGHALLSVEAFDLFPNTAHVEALVVLARRHGE